MWWIMVSPRRVQKQSLVAEALRDGTNEECRICIGPPPDPIAPFIAIGQKWGVELAIPPALAHGQPFWIVDNGYYKASGKGKGLTGHYELTYRGLAPILMDDPDTHRFPAETNLAPWRRNPDGYVLLAFPGPGFGEAFGLNMAEWGRTIVGEIRRRTSRRIVTRDKWCQRPLERDLDGASVVVTHSSNVAVDAVVAGVPAIVEPTCPAAPVCSLDLDDIEDPPMPDRAHWWASLMNQQYTLDEMRDGTAWHYMGRVAAQVDR